MVDALVLGASVRKDVRVRISLRVLVKLVDEDQAAHRGCWMGVLLPCIRTDPFILHDRQCHLVFQWQPREADIHAIAEE